MRGVRIGIHVVHSAMLRIYMNSNQLLNSRNCSVNFDKPNFTYRQRSSYFLMILLLALHKQSLLNLQRKNTIHQLKQLDSSLSAKDDSLAEENVKLIS